MMQDLNSSRFSDEIRYKIYQIWNYRNWVMNYAILLHLITDFKYVQILIIQNPKQSSYLNSSWKVDQNGYITCQVWNSKSANFICWKIRQISNFLKKQKGIRILGQNGRENIFTELWASPGRWPVGLGATSSPAWHRSKKVGWNLRRGGVERWSLQWATVCRATAVLIRICIRTTSRGGKVLPMV